jgi:predicted transcriptional regulator
VVAAANRPVPELGELERGILRYLWRVGDADVLQVHAAVGVRRSISVNTVGSGLERLYRKRLVSRWKVSHAYRYKPTLDRDHFGVRQLADSVGGLQALASRGVLASFLDLVSDADESALGELEELIARKRRESKA